MLIINAKCNGHLATVFIGSGLAAIVYSFEVRISEDNKASYDRDDLLP